MKGIDEDNKCINVLVCTSRISLSRMLSETLKLKWYSDVKDDEHTLNSIYSLESPHKLTESLIYYDEDDTEN